MKDSQQGEQLVRWERILIGLVIVLLLGGRLAFLGGPIDEGSWRQIWCNFQARQLALESPPDFMNPKINFQGRDWVNVANPPFYEMAIAVAYRAIGHESLPVARIITLILFAGSTVYLYLIIRKVTGPRTAAYVALAYMYLPLGIFYSRAIHYDIMVLFLAHAFVYHTMRHLENGCIRDYLLALVALTLAFSTKPPYVVFAGPPLLVFVLFRCRGHYLRAFACLASMAVLPYVVFSWYDAHRMSIELTRHTSVLEPNAHTVEAYREYYIGSLAQRFDWDRWHVIFQRVYWMLVTPPGILLAALGGGAIAFRGKRLEGLFLGGWCLGALGYVLFAFPMVSGFHDYYSLPLMAPVAILLGWGLSILAGYRGCGFWLGLPLLVVYLFLHGMYARHALRAHHYFTHDEQLMAAGAKIAEWTRPDDLVVCSAIGRSTGDVDPRILYFADRLGYANEMTQLTPENLALYHSVGTAWLAVLVTPDWYESGAQTLAAWGVPSQMMEICSHKGERLGRLYLFSLSSILTRPLNLHESGSIIRK